MHLISQDLEGGLEAVIADLIADLEESLRKHAAFDDFCARRGSR